MFKLQISLFDRDHVAMQIATSATNTRARLGMLIQNIIIASGVWALVLLLLSIFVDMRFAYRVLLMLLFIIIIIAFRKDYSEIIAPSTKAVVDIFKKYGKLYEPYFELEFGENEITLTAQAGKAVYQHADIARVLTDKHHFFISFAICECITIPTRCLHGREQEFLDFLKLKIPAHIYKTIKFKPQEKSKKPKQDNPYNAPQE